MESIQFFDHPGAQGALVAAGLALVFFGRRLFWLLLGLAGALVAVHVGVAYFGLETRGTGLLIALAIAMVGAFLAFFVQRLAVGIGGLLIGAYAVISLLGIVPAEITLPEVAAVLAGGLFGALLGAKLFEVALILVTALGGALFTADGLALQGMIHPVAVGVLCLLGLFVQSSRSGGRKKKK